MKQSALWLLLFLTTWQQAVSQKKSDTPNKFTLVGNIKGLSEKIIYLKYWDEDDLILDSSIINQGKFSFRGALKGPAYAQLTTSDENFFYELFLENSKMTISRMDSSGDLVFSGSTSQLEYQQAKKITADFQAGFGPMEKTIEWKADSAAATIEWEKKANILRAAYQNDIKEFIRNHPESVVSAYQLIRFYKILKLSELQELYKGLSDSLQQSYHGQLASKKIESLQSSAMGAEARDFRLKDVKDNTVQLSHLRGRYVLIDFWASWCKPCRIENPNVVNIYNKYKGSNFEIIGVSLDNQKDKWKEAIIQDGLAWINVSDLDGWKSEVVQQYAVSYVPTNFLLNPEGVIIAKDLRGVELEKKLAEILNHVN